MALSPTPAAPLSDSLGAEVVGAEDDNGLFPLEAEAVSSLLDYLALRLSRDGGGGAVGAAGVGAAGVGAVPLPAAGVGGAMFSQGCHEDRR